MHLTTWGNRKAILLPWKKKKIQMLLDQVSKFFLSIDASREISGTYCCAVQEIWRMKQFLRKKLFGKLMLISDIEIKIL